MLAERHSAGLLRLVAAPTGRQRGWGGASLPALHDGGHCELQDQHHRHRAGADQHSDSKVSRIHGAGGLGSGRNGALPPMEGGV